MRRTPAFAFFTTTGMSATRRRRPRRCAAASACSTTTATAGSTSTLFRAGRFLRLIRPRTNGDRLFRNRGDGTFVDVTESTGIASFPGGYGHGVAVADYDNDGRPDLFVTRWRSYALYRNKGDGTFRRRDGPGWARRRSRLADIGGVRRPRRRRRSRSLRLPLFLL